MLGRSQSGATFNANERTIRSYTPITTQKLPEDMVSPFQHTKRGVVEGAINN